MKTSSPCVVESVEWSERHSVYFTRTMLRDCLGVSLCAVSLVLCKSILWKQLVIFHHHPITRHLHCVEQLQLRVNHHTLAITDAAEIGRAHV